MLCYRRHRRDNANIVESVISVVICRLKGFMNWPDIPITPGCPYPNPDLSRTCEQCRNEWNATRDVERSGEVGRLRTRDPEPQSPSPRSRVRQRRDSDPQPLRRSDRVRSRERPRSMDMTDAEIQQISSRRRGRDPSAVVPRKERRVSTETKAKIAALIDMVCPESLLPFLRECEGNNTVAQYNY